MHIAVIPAEPNTRVVHDIEGTLEALDFVVGWRVSTTGESEDELVTIVSALTADGEMGTTASAVGIQHPDGSVTMISQSVYPSLAEAQAGYK